MSRRFGRNQKRRARARIQELEKGVQMANGLAQHAFEKRREAEGVLKEILSFVSGNSIFTRPQEMERGIEALRVARSADIAFRPMHEEYRPDDVLRTIDILMHDMTPEMWEDAIGGAVHFRFALPGGAGVGYKISENALWDMGADNFSRLVGGEVIRMMVQQLKKSGRLRGR